jgi:hypothetical protein
MRRFKWRPGRCAAVVAAAVTLLMTLVPLQLLGTASAQAATCDVPATFTPLSLLNGWTNEPHTDGSVAGAGVICGIVHLRGAIATGATANPFVLPAAFRPATEVFVPADVCGQSGRLDIAPNGVVTVQAESVNIIVTQCGVSLEGVTFALSSAGSFTPLQPSNGWSAYGAAQPAARNLFGIVSLTGAITTAGNNPDAFTLPPGLRPVNNVFVPVDMCNATNGRLDIAPNGDVLVQAETSFSNAQCFTSLDGVSFAASPSPGSVQLAPGVGWTSAPFGTSNAAAETDAGIVYLEGAIGPVSASPSGVVLVLPAAFRPAHNVTVVADFTSAHYGSVTVFTDGVVFISTDLPANNPNFVSLDGVSFAL